MSSLDSPASSVARTLYQPSVISTCLCSVLSCLPSSPAHKDAVRGASFTRTAAAFAVAACMEQNAKDLAQCRDEQGGGITWAALQDGCQAQHHGSLWCLVLL